MGLVLIATLLQTPFVPWTVEDAGISFAYARSLAEGWGPRPHVGSELVEGYSNPLWVALLAVAQWLEFDVFASASALGMVSVAVAVLATWAVGRAWGRPLVGWLGAALLATHAQLLIWSQSGLENGLFAACVAVGLWRLSVRDDRWGAPLAFTALALTRPEGLVWAGMAAVGHLSLGAKEDRVATVARGWAVGFVAPMLAYHLVRYGVFALPWPATYYAKLGGPADFDWFAWDRRQWTYLARYAEQTGAGVTLPLMWVGLLGTGRVAWVAWAVLAVAWAAVLGLPAEGYGSLKAMLVALCTAVPVAVGAVRRPRLALVGALGLVGLAFCVRSTGDWMRGFRWLSLTAVPASLLLAAGLDQLWWPWGWAWRCRRCATCSTTGARRRRRWPACSIGRAGTRIWPTPCGSGGVRCWSTTTWAVCCGSRATGCTSATPVAWSTCPSPCTSGAPGWSTRCCATRRRALPTSCTCMPPPRWRCSGARGSGRAT
jgi:hypothetical protein